MADLLAEIEEMIRLRMTRSPSINQMRGWKAEIERLQADAERYRYLRSRPEDTIGKGGVFAGMTRPPEYGAILTEGDLDRAVDAARNNEQTTGAAK